MNKPILILLSAVMASMFSTATVSATKEMPSQQTMVAQCRALAQAGHAPLAKARTCILLCGRVESGKHSNTSDAMLKQCQNAYTKATQQPVPAHTPNRSPKVAAIPQSHVMADIEGIYLQTSRNGFKVRAEGRKDWKTYCNEAARLMTGSNKFSRTVKAYDHVRLIGVHYDPSRANKLITRCLANSAVIIKEGTP